MSCNPGLGDRVADDVPLGSPAVDPKLASAEVRSSECIAANQIDLTGFWPEPTHHDDVRPFSGSKELLGRQDKVIVAVDDLRWNASSCGKEVDVSVNRKHELAYGTRGGDELLLPQQIVDWLMDEVNDSRMRPIPSQGDGERSRARRHPNIRSEAGNFTSDRA
jgi:hypothetical protein